MEKERTLNWFMDMLAICKTELGLTFNSDDDAHVKNIFEALKEPEPLEENEREIDLSGLMLGTHVIVPKDPTNAMITELNKYAQCIGDIEMGYKAMIQLTTKES